MGDQNWDQCIQSVSPAIMRPIIYSDLEIIFLEILGAQHGNGISQSHRHPWFEFNYISRGALFTRMENIEFLAAEGDFFLIPPGVMHSHRDYDQTGDDGFCVRWEMKRIDRPIIADPYKCADDIITALTNFKPRSYQFKADQLFTGVESLSIYELEATFLIWFLEIHRLMNPDSARLPKSETGWKRTSTIKQVLMYLEEYCRSQFNVHDLADSVGYSYRHLARLFKEDTGSTIVEKLNGIRIAQAIDLLENIDLPISAIGKQVGFNTETYFSTLFTRYTHVSPSRFRASHRPK